MTNLNQTIGEYEVFVALLVNEIGLLLASNKAARVGVRGRGSCKY